MNYLLDTNICIYWLNGEEAIKDKIINLSNNDDIGISIITLSELQFGAYNSKNVNKNLKKIEEFKDNIQIYNINQNCTREYAKIKAKLRKEGKILDDFDILIGATAIINTLTLVTNNEKHFSRMDNLNVENWVNE